MLASPSKDTCPSTCQCSIWHLSQSTFSEASAQPCSAHELKQNIGNSSRVLCTKLGQRRLPSSQALAWLGLDSFREARAPELILKGTKAEVANIQTRGACSDCLLWPSVLRRGGVSIDRQPCWVPPHEPAVPLPLPLHGDRPDLFSFPQLLITASKVQVSAVVSRPLLLGVRSLLPSQALSAHPPASPLLPSARFPSPTTARRAQLTGGGVDSSLLSSPNAPEASLLVA